MDMNYSGEELVAKSRKPYTITKQRERWSEEEHNRFLEALKLYGRAWQRIEEHIGTKTAVQIRSHAQKFFTKLEKEAIAKGIPLGQAHDIDIPPPRPKRKPISPYPRKRVASCVNFVTDALDEKTSEVVNPQATSKQDLGLETNTLLEVIATTKSHYETNKCSDGGDCSVLLNLFQDGPSASISSGNKCFKKQVSFREFVPTVKEPKEMHCIDRSTLSIEINMESSMNGSTKSDQALETINAISIDMYALQPNSALGETSDVQEQAMKSSDCDIQEGARRHNDHASKDTPMTCTDKSSPKVTVENGEFASNASPFMNHAIPTAPGFQTSSVVSSFSQPFPSFPTFAQLCNTQDFHRSFLNISSTFSSLIVSTLLQNPAVHAAACMAASLWPSAEMDRSVDSSVDSSSIKAIAAATVAAASAWWATHGLLPFFPPVHAAGFTYPPPPTTAVPIVNTGLAPQDRMEEKHGASYLNSSTGQQAFCSERLKVLKSQSLPSKLVLSSSSDSEEIKKGTFNVNNSKPLSGTTFHPTSDKAKIIKKPERSSCGSNTPSSSEVETDAAFKKNGETKDENKISQFHNLPSGEVNNRRARISGSINESWKEVSQEGRLAFQELFTRNVLPQTFFHQHAKVEMVFPQDMPTGKYETCKNGLLSVEVEPEKLKVCRSGFKPYKRCSAEVEDNRSSVLCEMSNKRIRLEDEASS